MRMNDTVTHKESFLRYENRALSHTQREVSTAQKEIWVGLTLLTDVKGQVLKYFLKFTNLLM
jgi:hypothetical protein